MKILIVDDNAPSRTLARAILGAVWNVEARECGDGSAAVQELATWRPDLILVDFEMRPMDGATFTRLLRAGGTGADQRTPVVMMTGHADRAHVLKAREAGVDGIIVKPLTIGSMLERIQATLARPRDVLVLQLD